MKKNVFFIKILIISIFCNFIISSQSSAMLNNALAYFFPKTKIKNFLPIDLHHYKIVKKNIIQTIEYTFKSTISKIDTSFKCIIKEHVIDAITLKNLIEILQSTYKELHRPDKKTSSFSITIITNTGIDNKAIQELCALLTNFSLKTNVSLTICYPENFNDQNFLALLEKIKAFSLNIIISHDLNMPTIQELLENF